MTLQCKRTRTVLVFIILYYSALMFPSIVSTVHSLGPLKSTRDEDTYKYKFEFKAKTDNVYTITPLSNILLFSPTSLKVLGVNDCQDDIATFVGDVGKVSAPQPCYYTTIYCHHDLMAT